MKFTTDHILQIAIEMERRGQTFYESLAIGCGHDGIAALATSIAKSEMQHIAIFEQMLRRIPAGQRGPALTEIELFNKSTELCRAILPDAQELCEAVVTSDLLRTMDLAIKMEDDAAEFYSRLAARNEQLDKTRMDQVVAEERDHARELRAVRAGLLVR